MLWFIIIVVIVLHKLGLCLALAAYAMLLFIVVNW